jgi:hypothetical protein
MNMKKYKLKVRNKIIVEKIVEISIPKDDDIADYRDEIEDSYYDIDEGKITTMEPYGFDDDLHIEVI